MKAVDLRALGPEELAQHERETRDNLFELKLRQSSGDASEKPVRLRGLRRELARILTIRREQETHA